MSLVPMGNFPNQLRPYQNITPFTYRDGLTYLEVLESLREWLRVSLVPHLDAEHLALVTAWEKNVSDLIALVNEAIADNTLEVDTKIGELESLVSQSIASNNSDVASKIAALQSQFNVVVQEIITAGITVSDPVMSGVAGNKLSAFYAELRKIIKANSTETVGGGLNWRIATDPKFFDGVNIAQAIQAAADDISSAGGATHGGLGLVYLTPGKWSFEQTINIDARKVALRGNNSRLVYTGTGVAFQVLGSQGGEAANNGPVISGIRLSGPGKLSTAIAIKMNTDDALTTLSYVATHPIEDTYINNFGVGILYAKRAWGNTLSHCMISSCGIAFRSPAGMDSSMGERLAFDDTTISDNDIGVLIESGAVETVYVNCSFDYNGVASKTVRNEHFIGCHIETNAATWNGLLGGHFQHLAKESFTSFSDCTFVLGSPGQGITSEVFEPYNVAATFNDIYARADSFVFTSCKFTPIIWGEWKSRLTGFPHKRLVNEISGARGIRRGIFNRTFYPQGQAGPIFGASRVPARSYAGVALPTMTLAVSAGDPLTSSSTLDDLTGTPQSFRSVVAPATANGVNNFTATWDEGVSPSEWGCAFNIAQIVDFTTAGADSERTVYATAYSRDGQVLSTFDAWAGFTPIPQGSRPGVSIWPTGYTYNLVPTGTAYIRLQLQVRKIRVGDMWNIYPPLFNIA